MDKNFMEAFRALERSKKMADTLNTMASVFLSNTADTFESMMTTGMGLIADMADLDRLNVWRNHSMPDGLYASQIYRWDRESGGTTEPTVELKNIPYSKFAPRWEKILPNGKSINSPVRLMPEERILDSLNAVSVFVTPIFLKGNFWGFVIFSDNHNERYFDDECAEMMRSAAFLCANAIIRAEMDREIARANKFNQAILKSAPFGLTVFDENVNIIDCNDEILKICNTTKQNYVNDFYHFCPEYQHGEEKSVDKALRIMKKVMETGTATTTEWIHKNTEGELIPCEITITCIEQDGEYTGLAFAYDMRNIKRLEKEMSKVALINQAILDAMPVGLAVFTGKPAGITDCNAELEKMFKAPKERIISRYFEDFSPKYLPDGRLAYSVGLDILRRALVGESIRIEWPHQTVNGDPVPCELMQTCVQVEDEVIVLAFLYDLSNVKKMEREIRRVAQINQAILDNMPVGMAVFDGTPKVVDCNKELIRMFDAPKEQIISRYYEDFSPEYLPNGRKAIDEAYDINNRAIAGEIVRTEWPHKTLAGEAVPCDLTLMRIKNEDDFVGIGFLYDLSDLKKISQNLHEQGDLLKVRLKQQEFISGITKSFVTSGEIDKLIDEAIIRLRHYLNASRVIIFGIDFDRRDSFLAYSSKAEDVSPPTLPVGDIFNFIESTFPHTLPVNTVTPMLICSDVINDPMLKMLSSLDICAFTCAPLYVEGSFWGILSVERCDKAYQWQEIEVSFIATIASVISGAIMRTVYDSRLKNALERATVASEAKGMFLSNMSHEIRTPMNAIIGMTVIGKSAGDVPRKDYCFEKIENASQHLLGVINDILDMSKIEANKFELSYVEFDFEKMLQRVINIVSFRADEKKQKLTVHIDKSIPRILFGDDQRLAQVITNLLSNAVKFTPEEGSIKLETRFLCKENDEYTVQITVSDSGIGISEKQKQQLFSSFQQADSGTSRKYGGTGLGLVISKNIVELMGGDINLSSEIGKGSSFSFTFKTKRGTKKVPSLSEIGVNWDNVSIMAIDDDKEILDYFSDVMQSFGTNCDTATSGKEALALVGSKGMYDIYFVDWKMPDMDGIKLARELKAKSKTPDQTIIIMISAAEWSGIADEAKKAGVDKFLSKPLFPSSIADAITEAIGLDHIQKKDNTDNYGIFKGYKILLAEDVDINREIVETLVSPTLLELNCAGNGLEAVTMFENAPDYYDLILMDVQMPEMDGYQATRRIREFKHSRAKTIPIIAMTANVFREEIEKCFNAGMNDHVGKPFDIDEFFNILRKYLQEKKQ